MTKTRAALLTGIFVALMTHNAVISAQTTAPGFDAVQRLALAKRFLEPIREAALADPDSPERKHYLTQYTAQYDPVWTARFILDHPVPKDGGIYDNKAMLVLMKRPGEIPSELLLDLLRQSQGRSTLYAMFAIRSLPEDQHELRQKIIDLTFQRTEDANVVHSFAFRLALAEQSQNPEHLKRVNQEINEFFKSGRAAEQWKQVRDEKPNKRNMHDRTYKQRFAKILTSVAPEEYKDDFKLEGVPPLDPLAFLRDESTSDLERIRKLESIDELDFGQRIHEQMSMAGLLGLVAVYDLKRALKWADAALEGRPQIWAKLQIAPSLAKEDVDQAKQLIKESFDQIVELDGRDTEERNYNFSASRIGSAALPLVAAVDPELLPECIDKIIAASQSLQTSRMHSAQQHLLLMIAAIAAYDLERARELFDKHSDDVKLSSAPAFFRAMLAVYPDQVWQEYQDMPESDHRGIKYQIRVRNAILPGLLKRDDAEFWHELNNMGSLGISPRVLDR